MTTERGAVIPKTPEVVTKAVDVLLSAQPKEAVLPKGDTPQKVEPEATGVPEATVELKPGEEVKDPAVEAEREGKYFKSEDEYNLELERTATKMAESSIDKKLNPLYQERSTLKKENEALLGALGIQRTAEIESWGDEPQVRDFHHRQDGLMKAEKQLQSDVDEYTRNVEEYNKDNKELNAWRLALENALPEGSKLSSVLSSFVKELNGAQTDREATLLAKVRASAIQKAVSEVFGGTAGQRNVSRQTPKPDNSAPTGGSGRKVTRGDLAAYNPKGKSVAEMTKDVDAVLEQLTIK